MAMAFFDAIIFFMEVTIDSAGRIVVPKAVRDRLGLHKDSKLELEDRPEGVFLRPVVNESGLSRDEHGWLVHKGRPTGKLDWDHIVNEDREERMRKIGGW
jgi:AbrB family looped-hinge helix DNA binding protein